MEENRPSQSVLRNQNRCDKEHKAFLSPQTLLSKEGTIHGMERKMAVVRWLSL